MQAEQMTDPVAYHGEGPVWSPALGRPALGGHARRRRALARAPTARSSAGTSARSPPRCGPGAAAARSSAIERGFALEDPDGAVRRSTSSGAMRRSG